MAKKRVSVKKDQESITIDPTINSNIRKIAERERRTFSGMIEFACSEYIDKVK